MDWRLPAASTGNCALGCAPLQAAGILILDDLGKEPADRRSAWVIYHLVEHCTAHGKPILFTTNYNGEELALRLGKQGPYVVHRLREVLPNLPPLKDGTLCSSLAFLPPREPSCR